MRIGLIARMDKTGLGNQTRNLAKMLRPSKIMVIDSTPFNKNKQYPQTYEGFNAFKVNGFPNSRQIRQFLQGVDIVISCEIFYSSILVNFARQNKIKTVLQYNYEFLDNLRDKNHPIADINLSPSYWKMTEATDVLGKVTYLPPPTDNRVFAKTRERNFANTNKNFLHIVGRQAVHDRNGTLDLLESLKYSSQEFTLTIKCQAEFATSELLNIDRRVKFDFNAPDDETELYSGFDAMILPRRYGGLCLPMNEALMSGLPVIMTDISPNNQILPKEWLVPSKKIGSFMTRTEIDLFQVDVKKLGQRLDWLATIDLDKEKAEAFYIGYENYSHDELLPKYQEVLGL